MPASHYRTDNIWMKVSNIQFFRKPTFGGHAKVVQRAATRPDRSTTSASVLLPTMQAIGSAFGQLGKVAPPAVSADMAALTTYWSQVVADFQYGKTVTQVVAYIKAHPPTNAATINGNMGQLDNYLTTTCHINLSS